VHQAAAILTFLSPGLRFFHQGQFDGRRARISPHLIRAPQEPTDAALHGFYEQLMSVVGRPTVREGRWQLLDCRAAWDGNPTSDGFVIFAWEGSHAEHLLVAVNYAGHQGQCYVRLPFADLGGRSVHLRDLMSDAQYDRAGSELSSTGLYLDLPAWKFHVFDVAAV
jgi:hypothetical protein